MTKPKLLPKRITSKMTEPEIKKYERLQKEWVKTGDDMLNAHEKATIYIHKVDKSNKVSSAMKKKQQDLINEGFRLEYIAFKKADEYSEFKQRMINKYTK